jgi:hypothetical protein
LEVLDPHFCRRRLIPGTGGYVVIRQNASGNWIVESTTTPTVVLDNVTAVTGQTFGRLLVQGSDNIMRTLTGPAGASLVMQTNAQGQVIFAAIPAATVPDPLSVTTFSAVNFTLGNGTITGTTTYTGLATGALAFTLGLDANGAMIKGTPATSVTACCMFFEAPTSPSATTPNSGVVAGGLLTIGNLIFDSTQPVVPGGAILSATNSQTLSVVQAGVFEFKWFGQVQYTQPTTGNPAISLLINGVDVNDGNSRPSGVILNSVRNVSLAGGHMRRMSAGDTVQCQLAPTSGANLSVYEVRLLAVRYPG